MSKWGEMMVELTDKEIFEISDRALEIGSAYNYHPLNVIRNMLGLFEYTVSEKNAVFIRCRDYLSEKENELPWRFSGAEL